MERVDDGPSGERVYQLLGLEPKLHKVRLDPFGHCVTDLVVPGEVHELEIRADQFGWIRLVYPDGKPMELALSSLSSTDAAEEDRRHVMLGEPSAVDVTAKYPVATGTYRATVRSLLDADTSPLASEPFRVEQGQTTDVVLRPRPKREVTVEVQNAATGLPIELPMHFWEGIAASDSVSGNSLMEMTRFSGQGDAYTAITWDLRPQEGLVRITLPVSTVWTFDPVAPLALDHGSKVILRAHPKD